MKCVLEPAINVYSREEYLRRIAAVKDLAEIIQFDVIDGIFARPGNYNEPKIVGKEIKADKIDLHLMVRNIPAELKRWLIIKPKRIILHVEAGGALTDYFEILEKNKVKKGLAIAPSTPLEKISPFVKIVDYLLILSVAPGRNGQTFIPNTIDRLSTIHKKFPALKIGVDGGVGEKHLLELKRVQASTVVVGSSIFRGEYRSNFQRFSEIIKQ